MKTDFFAKNLGKETRTAYGYRLLHTVVPRPKWISRLAAHQAYIFILTYLIYVAYHVVRKPLSVVKNVLHQQNCSHSLRHLENISNCAWPPFDSDDSKAKFSILDFTYRFSYAIGMFLAGPLIERLDIRTCLACVMIIAGLWMIFCGMAYFWMIHAFSYFVVGQLFSGLFQASGWPSLLPVLGNWFGKNRRGLIFGIWNTDTSVGNILGTLISSIWVDHEWGHSFIVPGLVIAGFGIIAYFFLIVRPEHVGLPTPDHGYVKRETSSSDAKIDPANSGIALDGMSRSDTNENLLAAPVLPTKPISVWTAITTPGVIEYAFCLFFCKAVFYAFFFWLPVYIKEVAHLSNSRSADMSSLFDAGGIIGGILGGFVSDYTKHGRATVCFVMLTSAIPCIYCMERYVTNGVTALVILLIVIGMFLNGPYTLICTSVSADIGVKATIKTKRKALSTIVAVIDFMGALGSALGPLGAGLLSVFGWQGVFYYLMVAQVAALLSLSRLVFVEIRAWFRGRA